ncbi:hypothetical protein GCM10010285_65050 [Streptomyces pseudogriseolus]|uniref:Uncharacterized protein n=1 Tax=Streptomyces pseudogriseolus TaxID=36817 RepID=A0ABQ2TM76_STREZ|nr:hypothetical protein GCM10010285_65050 [Streptomyces rubiginosus]
MHPTRTVTRPHLAARVRTVGLARGAGTPHLAAGRALSCPRFRDRPRPCRYGRQGGHVPQQQASGHFSARPG